MFAASANPVSKPSRSLRVRLTASYAVVFTLLLLFICLLFRQYLAESLDSQIRGAIEQDWGTLKVYLRIEKGRPLWYADEGDLEELALKGRLQRVFMLADAKGNEITISPVYRTLPPESKQFMSDLVQKRQSVWREIADSHGEHYLVRSSFDNDEVLDNTYYFISIGRSLKNNHDILRGFTWLCVGIIPLVALAGCVSGWVYAGRALSPVMDIARTAGRISGSNLSMRIPTRRSGDELDYLIETFNRMIERLQLSFDQIRQFSTDVSHELRTPITIVRGQLEVALFTAQTPEQYREAIVDSLHDIERLSQIVRALLLLSQAETGQVTLQKARVDLGEVLTDLVDQFQIPAESAQVRLFAEHVAADSIAMVDRVQIERMLSNLLSNAVKFTPAGGEVKVSLTPTDHKLELVIADTGRGIAPEHLPHIFDRFYRVSTPAPESPEKGLGLGLSFVAWIVKAHGGTVDVVSTLGEGTRFTILLPRALQVLQPSSAETQIVNRA